MAKTATKYLFTYTEMHNFVTSEERVKDEGWLIVRSTLNRDSDSIDQSNHRVIQKALAKLDPDQETRDTMKCSHWAVGWVDHFIVAPDSQAAKYAEESLRSIDEIYAILDDNDHSALECELHSEGECDEHCSLCESDKED